MTAHDDTAAEARAALAKATSGKWEWLRIVAPDWMPDTYQANDGLRVTTPTPGKRWDAEIKQVIEPMKSGFLMVRNADAEFIANAPDWLRALLDERDKLKAVVDAADDLIDSVHIADSQEHRMLKVYMDLRTSLDSDADGREEGVSDAR